MCKIFEYYIGENLCLLYVIIQINWVMMRYKFNNSNR